MFSRIGHLLNSLLGKVRRVFAAKKPETTPPASAPASRAHPDVLTTRNSPPQTCIAVHLPSEIVSLILSHLPAESVVAFGLTCRRFHAFMPSPPRLTEEARQSLLG